MQYIARLQSFLDQALPPGGAPRVLEAGCGSASRLRFGPHAHVVGIDISSRQLERNRGLAERICGDIQSYPLPPDAFDVIVCWDVLEHLPHPERAVENFARAVRPRGLVILKQPNVLSVKGMLTKALPFPLHVWYYREVMGKRGAGTDDVGPFRTYLRLSITPRNLLRRAHGWGLEGVYFDSCDIGEADYLRRRRLPHLAYRTAHGVARLLSLGKLGDSDFVVVLRRGGGVDAAAAGAASVATARAAAAGRPD